MSWNDPSGNKHPWGGKKPSSNTGDLDQALRNMRKKLTAALGGKKNDKEKKETDKPQPPHFLIWLIIIVVILIWVLSGIFIVSPAEKAVVLRFGKYIKTVGPGPHWVPPLIDSRHVVNVQKIYSYDYRSEMLTKDENIVDVEVTVQYRINNPRDYLFNIVNPQESLQQATARTLRSVIGRTTLDEILTIGRAKVREEVYKELTNLLKKYQSGLVITEVAMQPAKPPEQVTAAFDDAIKAREDQQRYINQATAYANQVKNLAQGNIARLLKAATAFKQEVVLNAKAQIAKYLALLPAYRKGPQVTRERLYLDTMQSIMGKTSKVLVDTSKTNNLIYLPLDKILQKKAPAKSSDADADEDTIKPEDKETTASRPGRPATRSAHIPQLPKSAEPEPGRTY